MLIFTSRRSFVPPSPSLPKQTSPESAADTSTSRVQKKKNFANASAVISQLAAVVRVWERPRLWRGGACALTRSVSSPLLLASSSCYWFSRLRDELMTAPKRPGYPSNQLPEQFVAKMHIFRIYHWEQTVYGWWVCAKAVFLLSDNNRFFDVRQEVACRQRGRI